MIPAQDALPLSALYGRHYFAHDLGLPYERNDHWLEFFGHVADGIQAALAPRRVLDAGCAYGFLVEALRARGVHAFGLDVSDYAIGQVHESVRPFVRVADLVDPIEGRFDLVTSIEVLEHVPPTTIGRVLDNLCSVTDQLLISSSPVDFGEPTHLGIRPPEDWAAELARRGFYRAYDVDASFITPWAVLYRKGSPSIVDVVRDAERAQWRLRQEATELRARVLQLHAEMEMRDQSDGRHFPEFEELLAARDQALTFERQLGEVRGQLCDAEAQIEGTRHTLTDYERMRSSPVVRVYTPYARLRESLGTRVPRGPRAASVTARWSLLLIRPPGATDADAEATRTSVAAQRRVVAEVLDVADDGDSIVHALNRALARAHGEWVAVLEAGDLLRHDALDVVEAALGSTPESDFVYTAEDGLADTSGRVSPVLKPAWSPDRLRCQMYTGRLSAYRRASVVALGGYRPELEGAHEFDLALRMGEHTHAVVYVDEPLVRRRRGAVASGLAPGEQGLRSGAAAITEHLTRTGFPASVAWDGAWSAFRLRPALVTAPPVSIVIPTAGTHRRVHTRNVRLVRQCVESIVTRSTYPDFEVVCVVDEPAAADVTDDLADFGTRVRTVVFNQPFHFSRKVNLGVHVAEAEHLLILNDDTEVITPEWIEHLMIHAVDPEVGAVGGLLLFGDGRLQHAGVVSVDGSPGHGFYGFPGDHPGYFGNLRVPGNALAVTAACLLTKRGPFLEVGGFSLAFPSNYNDVDYCLKLRRRGYRIAWTPEARLYHYESSSRGAKPVAAEELAELHRAVGRRHPRRPVLQPSFRAQRGLRAGTAAHQGRRGVLGYAPDVLRQGIRSATLSRATAAPRKVVPTCPLRPRPTPRPRRARTARRPMSSSASYSPASTKPRRSRCASERRSPRSGSSASLVRSSWPTTAARTARRRSPSPKARGSSASRNAGTARRSQVARRPRAGASSSWRTPTTATTCRTWAHSSPSSAAARSS